MSSDAAWSRRKWKWEGRSSMGTVVTYNGVELHNILTKQWDEEVVYDPSGTDLICHRYKLRFSGIMHVQKASGDTATAWIKYPVGGTPGPGGTAVEMYQTVSALLHTPRRELIVKIGDKEILRVDGLCESPTPRTDMETGPKPREVKITQIVNTQVFRVEFAIDCARLACWEPGYGNKWVGPATKPVVSNRWSVSETIDDNFFTTRTIKGRLRLSGAYWLGHSCRGWGIPVLESGFRRDRIEWTALENGLECEYTVIDKQVANSAPWPATKMDCTHMVTSDTGMDFRAEVSVRLEGSPASDRRAMIAAAIMICEQKLCINSAHAGSKGKKLVKGQDYYPEGFYVTDYVGEKNMVEVRIRIRYLGVPMKDGQFDSTADPKVAKNLYAQVTEKLGQPLSGEPNEQGYKLLSEYNSGEIGPYKPTLSPLPALWGYDPYNTKKSRDPRVVLYLLHCYLQEPCTSDHAIQHGLTQQYEPAESVTGERRKGTEVSGSTTSALDSISNLSDETVNFMYTYARMTNRYFNIPCRVQLPRSNYDASNTDTSEDTCCIFDIGLPQARREIHVDFERVGNWPEIPEPMDEYADSTGDSVISGKLLKHWERAMPPGMAADMNHLVYRIEAYYLYALNRPIKSTDAPYIGVLPQTNLTQGDNTFVRFDNVWSERLAPGEAVE